MSDTRPSYDDEIDLFELFETLWDGKWWILGCVAIAISMAFGYTQLASVKYSISASYSINVHSVGSLQLCEQSPGVAGCLNSEGSQRVLKVAGSDWSKGQNSTLIQTTLNPDSMEEYEQTLSGFEESVTETVLKQAKAELNVIQNELTPALLGTERVAANMLNAKRVIAAIEENDISAVSFDNLSISKSSPNIALILVMSVFLGGMVGVFYVLIRNAIYKRKKQLAKT
ncbi:Wzz/FepE/Etk N-terminal domain-containing protein [Saccharospirillum sp.]|uniref:Wzz/FepE/Etk N-terminal domain-containing protein n=1 Tax=Saccharospirillum sp. TaxID=2033801 RepID=UPI00349FE327